MKYREFWIDEMTEDISDLSKVKDADIEMRILDMSAGNRAIWFDKNNQMCTFIDIRESVKPDIVMDSRDMSKLKANHYDLIVFDPPHVNFGKNSNMSKVYGHFTTDEIRSTIRGSGREAHRVAKKNALMVLKWNDHDQKLPTVLKMISDYWQPLFGHLTKDGPGSKTYWCLLRRLPYMGIDDRDEVTK